MPIDEIEISERQPPVNVVLEAKRVAALDDTQEVRVGPHSDGWEVRGKQDPSPGNGGPRDSAKAYGARANDVFEASPKEFTDDGDEFIAVFEEVRFDG